MATRASIKISNSDGSFVANIYHHYDGYPEALGARLMEICDGSIVNGLNSGQQGKTFNGFDDLACSVVFELKGHTGDGRVYLHAEDDFGQCGEDYLYENDLYTIIGDLYAKLDDYQIKVDKITFMEET